MSKKKSKDEVEELEQQIRELKSINRALLRRLKKVDRNYKEIFDEKDIENEHRKKAKEEERAKRACTHCERGELTEIDILGRIFTRCTVCDWKSGAKKKES
jgi:zona occludens toxin (predicted ATPase)